MKSSLVAVASSSLLLACSFAFVACEGNASGPNAPVSPGAEAGAVAPAGTGGISQPADPTGTMPMQETSSQSAAPASPMEGKCKSGEPQASAKDLAECKKSCQGLDETVPPGSRCIPARTSCAMACDQKFKK